MPNPRKKNASETKVAEKPSRYSNIILYVNSFIIFLLFITLSIALLLFPPTNLPNYFLAEAYYDINLIAIILIAVNVINALFHAIWPKFFGQALDMRPTYIIFIIFNSLLLLLNLYSTILLGKIYGWNEMMLYALTSFFTLYVAREITH